MRKEVRLKPGPAVGGKSAVGDGGLQRHWKIIRDIVKNMSDTEKAQFTDYEVFKASSSLWGALAQETQQPGTIAGLGTLCNEPVFFTINVYASETHEETLARHSNAWVNGFKELLAAAEGDWKTLLADVPGRPWRADLRRPSASVEADNFLGLMSKYNLQYRRPAPNNLTMLDNWTLSLAKNIPDYVVKLLTSERYHVDVLELRHTHVWQQCTVDWKSWREQPSSMLISVVSVETSASAVGEIKYYTRSVTTTTFLAFCYLLGKQFSARDIEAAWLELPVVKPGKQNRGASGGGSKKNKWKYW